MYILTVLSSRLLFAKSEEEDLTVRHHVEVTQLRNVIMRSLSELRQSQRVLMPGLGPILDAMGNDETAEVSFKLLLPSELSIEDQHAWCLLDVPALEFWFCYAQADDSLAKVHRLLRLFQNLHSHNSKHLGFAQRALTRTRGVFDSLRTKIHHSSGRYSHARNTMLALNPDEKFNPGWTKRFQMLNEGDARGPGREADDTSEGQFTPSWIWLVPWLGQRPPSATTSTSIDEPSTGDDPEQINSMRVHWAKCQAQAERYKEEVKLTIEEMGRMLCYFRWRQSWWVSLQSQREESDSPPPASVQRELQAYTHRQANIYTTLVLLFINQWRKTLNSHKLQPAWLSHYPAPATNERSHSQPSPESTDPSHGTPSSPLPQDDGPGTPLVSEMEVDEGYDDDGGDDNDSDEYADDVDVFEFDFEDELMV